MFSTLLFHISAFFIIGLVITLSISILCPPMQQQAEWWLRGGMAVKRNKDGTSTLLIAKPKDEDLLDD